MTLPLAIGGLCIAFFMALLLNRLALRPWRRSIGQHWTERARLLYPVQKSASINILLIPINVAIMGYAIAPDVDFLKIILSGYAGSVMANFFLSREVFPGLTIKSWLRLIAAGMILFLLRWAVICCAIFEMPDNFGAETWLIAGGILVLFLAFGFGLVTRVLRLLGLLEPATGHLNALVAEMSQKMGVPVKATWILSTYVCNALALPLTRELIFTDKLLEALPDEETKSICAHELGHINESGGVKSIRLLVSMAFYPLIFCKPLLSLGGTGSTTFTFLVACVFIVWLLGIRTSRRMEQRADNIAQQNTIDAGVYARALERIYQANQTPAVMPVRSAKIHPNLYDRMTSAGVTPDFPRPKASKGQCWTSILMSVCLILLPACLLLFKSIGYLGDASLVQLQGR